eukprot:TRINITY_DN2390_c0_g1_i4.p1 TRINITY_DN2390_c0_g1~~TRINITY_DN2390_c0_g1_i4.p1  ORF type:complete len:431 (-),score=71.50 TRINITY_DN2390_c0_g1_i4:102-1394(-)
MEDLKIHEDCIDKIASVFEECDGFIEARFAEAAKEISAIEAEMLERVSNMRLTANKGLAASENEVLAFSRMCQTLPHLIPTHPSQPRSLLTVHHPNQSLSVYKKLYPLFTIKHSRKDTKNLPIYFIPGNSIHPFRSRPQQTDGPWLRCAFPITRDISNFENPIKEFSGTHPFSSEHTLSEPTSIAVHPVTSNIYITCKKSGQILCLSPDYQVLFAFGKIGQGLGEFGSATGIAISADGMIAVVDYTNDRVQIFETNGTFIRAFGTRGDGDGKFRCPYFVAFDSSGDLYVTDSNNDRVCKYNIEGKQLCSFGGRKQPGAVGSACGIYVDPHDFVYVMGVYESKIQVFDVNGTFVRTIDVPQSGGGSLANQIARGPNGSFVVSSYFVNKVWFIDEKGSVLKTLELTYPTGIAFTNRGDFICLSGSNGSMRIY